MGIGGGLLVLGDRHLGSIWHAVGLIGVGCLCVVMLTLDIWPKPFARRRRGPDTGPDFEVGDPNAPDSASPPTPLIQAMHRVRGKRRRPSGEDD